MTDEWAAFRTQPAPAPAVDEWAAFRTEQPPSSSARSSAAADIAKSTGVGVAEGLIGSAGFLGDANDLIGRGTGWLLEKVAGADATPAQLEQIEAARRGPLALLSPKTSADIRKPIEAVTGEFYQPQTTAGEYARTIGAFAPSAALGSGRIVPRIVGDVLAPAIMSETAGQLTAGTAAEPYARAAGGLAGNVAVTGARAYANADNAMAAQAARGVTDAEYQAAQRLQDTAARIGVPLSGPEAIQEATRGATKLADLQRVVEGSQSGGQVTSRFYASRPEQVATATRSALDAIAPASPNPSTLGPRAAIAAERAIAATPEGQALTDAIFGAGPRTTPLQAGEIIQPELRRVYDRREGFRNAQADADYAAARTAEPTIPIEDLRPEQTIRHPGYVRIEATSAEGADDAARSMASRQIEPVVDTPALTSRTGAEFIQADARPVVQMIDDMIPDARGSTQDALRAIRNSLFDRGGVDTSVRGLDSARGSINDAITEAQRNGQLQIVERLTTVRDRLDRALTDVPEYRSAREGFEAASRPLDPFASPGMAKTIQRDEFNTNFTTPAEQVPAALSSPSEARNFLQIASPDARVAMGNRLATQIMDKSSDGAGGISAERLAVAMRDSEDLLGFFPDVRQRLLAVVDAHAGVAGVRAGPLGRIAAARTTPAAYDELLPSQPLTGGADEIVTAIMRMSERDADLPASLVRQSLGDNFDQASRRIATGENQSAGGRFANSVAGTPEQRVTMDAILDAINRPAAREQVTDLMDVLRATSQRRPMGSPTEPGRMVNDSLDRVGFPIAMAAAPASAGATFFGEIRDRVRLAARDRAHNQLAELFTSPDSVQRIRNLGSRGVEGPWNSMLARHFVQTPMNLSANGH